MTGSQYLHGPELFLGVVLGGGGCDGHESAQLVVASHQEGQGVVAAQRGAHQHGILHPQGPQHTLQQLRPPGLCAGLLRRCGVPKTWEQEAPLREAGKELRTAAHHGGKCQVLVKRQKLAWIIGVVSNCLVPGPGMVPGQEKYYLGM